MPFITRLPALTGADPYPDALLALDFVGARRGPQYYKALGVTTADITKVPGWTYTGGTAAGTGSYAAKADGSLQFFPSYTNLAQQSQTFDNAAWAKSDTTISADATTAPDGTTTADKLVETATTNSHAIAKGAITAASGAAYTVSFYMKAAERTYAAIYDGISSKGKFFNLSAGTVGGNLVGAPDNATITNAGNGWYRCTITITTASTSLNPYIFLSTDGTTFSYAGTAGSGIYIWGAQLELGSTASTYIPTTTAAVTVGTPRITDAGYWAEEARTNSIPNNGTDGAVVGVIGSGGALPTGMGRTVVSGLTYDVVSIGSGAYGPYIDLRVYGTNSSGGVAFPGVNFTSGTTIVAATAQTWTGSFYSALIAGSASGVTAFNVNMVEGTAAGGYVTNGVTTYSPTSSVQRAIQTRTLSGGATVARVYLAQSQTIAAGATVDYTLRVSLPQMELGAFATSPIPTTSVAVTRAADVGQITGLVIPKYTILGSAQSSNTGTYATVVAGDSGVFLWRINTGTISVRQLTPLINVNSSVSPGTSRFNSAFSYDGSSINVTADGASVTTGAASGSAISSSVTVGQTGGIFNMNGPIRRIVIYPRAFGNSELQAITTAGAY